MEFEDFMTFIVSNDSVSLNLKEDSCEKVLLYNNMDNRPIPIGSGMSVYQIQVSFLVT